MTGYKLGHFTMAAAQALAGKTADITEWDDDEPERKVTYPGARITRIIALPGPCLVIETAGAVITDARTGERLGTRPPEPGLRVLFTRVCEVANVRGRFERGDRVALEHTDDPHTRLRPRDEGTVTRYDPQLGQLGVSWDSGSTLSMLLDDGDRVRLITPAPEAGTGEAGDLPLPRGPQSRRPCSTGACPGAVSAYANAFTDALWRETRAGCPRPRWLAPGTPAARRLIEAV